MSTAVRTRMAPSPTGEYHIGHIRTLLYNYAFAKKNHGQFIIRIEDTDQKRYVPGATERILEVIKDYGLCWDEGPDIGGPYAPYVQTKRLPIYQEYIQKLLDLGGAYYCFCTPQRLEEMRATQRAAKRLPKYDRCCLNLTPEQIKERLTKGEPYVIRLKMPDNEILSFHDIVRGEIKFNTADVDDQVLIKSDGIPTYHFAAGIDDHLMNITHVLRGDEWISSVPKQIILYRYFGWQLPQFAHLTVFLDPSGKGKMSKRHGSVSARSFLEAGYLPEALLNFLMLLGWNPGTNQEIFSLDEFIQVFDLNHLHKQQPIFDRKKLDYFNGFYIRQKSDDELTRLLQPFMPQANQETIQKIVPLIKDRITTLADAAALTCFLFQDINLDPALFDQKNLDRQQAAAMLSAAHDLLSKQSDWNPATIQPRLIDLIKANNWNTGQFFMAFRLALSGSPITPPIVDCLPILDKSQTLSRLQSALSLLQS
jgi:glutamyl-tRNA synthetase